MSNEHEFDTLENRYPFGSEITLDDINCVSCGRPVRGELLCKHCGQHNAYGEPVASRLEKEGYAVQPEARSYKDLEEYNYQKLRSESKLIKIGESMTSAGESMKKTGDSLSSMGCGCTIIGLIILGILMLL